MGQFCVKVGRSQFIGHGGEVGQFGHFFWGGGGVS